MSPLDDELRAALHGRAAVLAPSPDPLSGIESRARGIRRRKAAASIAGAALAVTAVAFAVPALRPSTGPAPLQRASQAPSSVSLDPANPWAFRGTPLKAGTAAAFQRDWAVKRPGSTLTPLFAQVYEPSAQAEAAFVATGPDGARFGYVTGSEAGARFLEDQPYPGDRLSLSFLLEADEGGQRLVVVTCPTCTIQSDNATLTTLAPGVFITSVERSVNYTVTSGDRTEAGSADVTSFSTETPANVLDWPTRGAMESDLVAKLPEVYASTLGTTGSRVRSKILFAGDTDSAVHFVMGQIWAEGDTEAHSFAYAEGGSNGAQVFFGPVTPKDPTVLAFLVDSLPGTTTDLLVVVPTPRTTQVLYDDDSAGAFRPVSTEGTDGVVLIDRSRTASADRLQLLTGNGDPATDVTFEGPVASLLCGDKTCS